MKKSYSTILSVIIATCAMAASLSRDIATVSLQSRPPRMSGMRSRQKTENPRHPRSVDNKPFNENKGDIPSDITSTTTILRSWSTNKKLIPNLKSQRRTTTTTIDATETKLVIQNHFNIKDKIKSVMMMKKKQVVSENEKSIITITKEEESWKDNVLFAPSYAATPHRVFIKIELIPPKPAAKEEEISPALLSAVTQPLIPTDAWSSLTGRELVVPSSVQALAKTGIEIAAAAGRYGDEVQSSTSSIIDWKPDKKTAKLLSDEKSTPGTLRKSLSDDQEVFVWTGKFTSDGHGSNLPLVRTRSVINMSPKDFALLLMDSSKVQTYNKMSLGRVDEVVFQKDVDSTAEGSTTSFGVNGETKIVRNKTKPPLTKKNVEFVTLMHARKLTVDDGVEIGVMGNDEDDCKDKCCGGYIIVSRAMSGGKWGNIESSSSSKDESEDDSNNNSMRSEILLGINLAREVPGHPDKTEVVAVTHVNSPSVPLMLAGTVGVKGAVDFVRDVRTLCSQ